MNRFLERISLFDIRSYLERKGWKRLAVHNDKWVIFRLEENQESIELILPSKERFSDVRETYCSNRSVIKSDRRA